jgi:hypothetical protein
MKGISCAVFPMPDHAFIEQSQFEGLLGDNFLEVLRFAPELLDSIVAARAVSPASWRCRPRGTPSKE